LARTPEQPAFDYRAVKYLQFDGTYFKHENCLMVLMDNLTSKVIAYKYHYRENYESAYQMFKGMMTVACNRQQSRLTAIPALSGQ
jgi:hypothetical protein